MNSDILTSIVPIVLLVVLVVFFAYVICASYKRNKILKNITPDNCPDCNEPMKYHNKSMYMWKCPQCNKVVLLLLDKEKNLVKAEYGTLSRKKVVLTVLVCIAIYAAILFAVVLDLSEIVSICVGVALLTIGILFILKILPRKTEYDEKLLNNVKLKRSLEEMRLIWSGLFLLLAAFMFLLAFDVDLLYPSLLAMVLVAYLISLFYVLNHNLEGKRDDST